MFKLFLVSSALTAALMACSGGPKPKSDHTTSTADQIQSDECCCKYVPQSAAAPVMEHGNRIECSTKQGECVDDQMCVTGDAPPP